MRIANNIPVPAHFSAAVGPSEPLPETHTIKQTMVLLNCGHNTVYKLASNGEVTLIKVFGKSLERFPVDLNRRGFPWGIFSDSGFLLAREAGMDGSDLIA